MVYVQSICILLVNQAVRGYGSVCAVAFYLFDVGITCLSVSVCASVELWGV